MEKSGLAALRRLSMSNETWQVARRQMRMWITPPDERPQRPYVILCQSLEGAILASDIEEDYPSANKVLAALVKAMRTPAGGAGPPRRPRCVQFEEAELVQALATALFVLDVRCEQAPLVLLEETLLDLETHVRGRKPIPGLLASPEMTADQVAGFFSAAAFYYREAPWRWLSDSEPVAVRCPPTARRLYALLMGNAGIEYGLAVYDSWSVLQDIMEARDVASMGRGVRWLAVLFNEITGVPFDDLESLVSHGWEIAGEQAYPVPIVLPVEESVQRPGARELGMLEAILRAIPVFVRGHLTASGGYLQPTTATLDVPVTSGKALVHLQFPAPPGRSSRRNRTRRRRPRGR